MPILQTLKGLAPENTGARPTLDTSADDFLLMRLGLFDAGLLHAVDPASWNGASPVAFREKASGRYIRATVSPDKIEDANFAGRSVMDFDNIPTSTDMRIKGSHQTASFTWVVVATRPDIPRVGQLINTSLRDSTYKQRLSLLSDGDLAFQTAPGTGNVNRVDYSLLPVPSVSDPHVYAVSYDNATKQSKIYLDNGSTALQTFTHTDAADWLATDELCIGGAGQVTGSSVGWFAKVGRVFVFNKALHVGHPTVLADLCDTLREIYGI